MTPAGRHSLRAHQSIKNLRTSRTPKLTDRSENVALLATFAPIGGPWTTLDACRSMRPATEENLSEARCAWRSTISLDFQPPSSISSGSEVPLCTCHEAQECLRSWKRKSSIPARCFALSQAVGSWRLPSSLAVPHRTHSKYGRLGRKPALDILDERYAKGDLTQEEYRRLKVEISAT